MKHSVDPPATPGWGDAIGRGMAGTAAIAFTSGMAPFVLALYNIPPTGEVLTHLTSILAWLVFVGLYCGIITLIAAAVLGPAVGAGLHALARCGWPGTHPWVLRVAGAAPALIAAAAVLRLLLGEHWLTTSTNLLLAVVSAPVLAAVMAPWVAGTHATPSRMRQPVR